jgi:hypothetical protein
VTHGFGRNITATENIFPRRSTFLALSMNRKGLASKEIHFPPPVLLNYVEHGTRKLRETVNQGSRDLTMYVDNILRVFYKKGIIIKASGSFSPST